MPSITASAHAPWYGTLTRTQWKTLVAANLGWMFDGYETFALILTVGVALRQLLEPAQVPQIPAYAGTVIAVTLLGWGIGGILGGILADYIGRRRTMIYAILAYSLITGLSALAFDWMSFALLRFLVGIAIGSEWSTGASITAEVWPDHARGKGAGLMQCGLGIGFFLASLVWLFVGAFGPGAWRFMYVLGVLPALFVLWIRTGIPESEPWERTNESRRLARARQSSGATLGADELALTRFTLTDLFVDPQNRRRALLVFPMSLTTTLAWWGISTWVPPYIGSVAAKAGLPAQQWASYAGMTYNLGAILGYASFGFLADRFGRKGVTMLFFAMALLLTPVLFLWTQDLGALAAGRCHQRLFQPRAVFLDAGLAARIVSHPHPRHRHGVRLQRPALHRLPRTIAGRQPDRLFRRLRYRRHHRGHHLPARPRGRAVPAGNPRKAAAGINRSK